MARPRKFDESTVLKAARETFWRLGMGNTSISDLEAATGLKRTSLYAAFGNKEELFKRTLELHQADSRNLMAQCLREADNALEGIRCLLRTSLEDAIDDPDRKGCYINNTASERTVNCPSVGDWINENRKTVIGNFSESLALAKHQGDLAPHHDEAKLANYLFTFYCGLMASVKAGTPPDNLREALELGLEVLER